MPRDLNEKELKSLSLEAKKQASLRKRAEEDIASFGTYYTAIMHRFREGIYRIEFNPPIPVDIPEEEQARLLITNGIMAECNNTFASLFSYEKAEDIQGAMLTDFINPADPHIIRANLKYLRSGYRSVDYEICQKDRYGRVRYILESAFGIVEKGHIVRTWGTYLDITGHREMEKNLRSALAELKGLKKRIEQESSFLQEELRSTHNFEEIIGESKALKDVLYKTEQVASTDATVIIQGETGTGKELIARAIHSLSHRKDRPLLKVNCANFNPHLMESELFGHEKGSFTGAVNTHTGRFEVADGSTIFLDEIGELPFELQSKLLRVLQDGEFERIGGTRTIKVDVRVLAATNRDLSKEVQSGRFREDLFYRLHVFPITVPPLRERREDIPVLIRHFLKQYAKKMGKVVNTVPHETMKELTDYPWPGNIRELQNVIEKAVITTPDSTLRIGFLSKIPSSNISSVFSLEEVERDYILRVLEQTGWQISGNAGAAAILKIHPNTLCSRMKKLGITRPKHNR
jgi:transcriptional regulator with PAS, ATPase and Fis domain